MDHWLSFGLWNRYSKWLATFFDENEIRIGWKNSHNDPDLLTDTFWINGVEPEYDDVTDVALIARVVLPGRTRKQDLISILIGGRTALGTAAASYYLANNFKELLLMYSASGHDLQRDSLAVAVRHHTDKEMSASMDVTAELVKPEGDPLHCFSRIRADTMLTKLCK